jgi:mannose-6-phosphate isomerase-like protein (cupin superfamily)
MSEKPIYRMSLENEVPMGRVNPPGTPVGLDLRMIYGTDMSLMFASRDPGYHTKPHMHDAEQLNYIVEGELWIFVEEHGYRCVKGDIMRIPRNKIHWAWNRGNSKCVMLEAHNPPLIGDERLRRVATPMLDSDEAGQDIQGVCNIAVDYPGMADTEQRSINDSEEAGRLPSP